jgi:NAD(P)-dependent dehydrogenase (short-subunit alcohol dehydrogenase family)
VNTDPTWYGASRVLVTGAASGIGRAFAERIATAGIPVVAVDVNVAGLMDLADQYPHVTPVEADVADPKSLAEVVGRLPCDGVVTCAAVGGDGLMSTTEPDVWHRLAMVNYLGTVWAVGSVLPQITRRGRGVVVVLSSSSGGMFPTYHEGGYPTTKAAVSLYARALRQEFRGSGVKIACVYPPAVRTPLLEQMPISRSMATGFFQPMSPDDVVRATEKSLGRNRFLVTPGVIGPLRFIPRLLPGLAENLPGIVYRRVTKRQPTRDPQHESTELVD